MSNVQWWEIGGNAAKTANATPHNRWTIKENTPHLPELFMLVSALMGLEKMQAAYRHAIEEGYRFYSYGDGSLLLPE